MKIATHSINIIAAILALLGFVLLSGYQGHLCKIISFSLILVRLIMFVVFEYGTKTRPRNLPNEASMQSEH